MSRDEYVARRDAIYAPLPDYVAVSAIQANAARQRLLVRHMLPRRATWRALERVFRVLSTNDEVEEESRYADASDARLQRASGTRFYECASKTSVRRDAHVMSDERVNERRDSQCHIVISI